MNFLAYNILEGGTGRIDPLAEVIRFADADLVITAEASDEQLFHRLADRLHMDRFWANHPTNPDAGIGLLSRWEIREAVNHAPLDRRLTRGALHAIVRKPLSPNAPQETRDLALIGAHLHAGELFADEEIRLTELPALLDIAKLFHARPHILAGDFNASHPQQPIDLAQARKQTQQRAASQKGQIPRTLIRAILEQGYLDAHALHHAPADFGQTLTTAQPALRTDYIFLTPTLAPHLIACDILHPEMARFASDHYPVLAKINL